MPAHIGDRLNDLIFEFAKKCYYLWRAKYLKCIQSDEYKARLIYFGLLNHGNQNDCAVSSSTISRRNNHMRKCIDYLNGCVGDFIDLRSNLLSYYWDNHPSTFDNLLPKFELMFIKKHNAIIKNLKNDYDYCIKRAIMGVINGWSQKTWHDYNMSVKLN